MIGAREHFGYAPKITNICDGDNTFPDICINCGQTQGEFPKPPIKLEGEVCKCSKEDRGRPADDGDGYYCINCGNDITELEDG